MIKISGGVALTNIETHSWPAVSGLATFSPNCKATTIPSFSPFWKSGQKHVVLTRHKHIWTYQGFAEMLIANIRFWHLGCDPGPQIQSRISGLSLDLHSRSDCIKMKLLILNGAVTWGQTALPSLYHFLLKFCSLWKKVSFKSLTLNIKTLHSEYLEG